MPDTGVRGAHRQALRGIGIPVTLAHSEGSPLPPDDGLRLVEIIAGFGRSQPDRTALVLGDMRISYGELERLTAAAMALFAAQGVRPGDRIAYIGLNNPVFVAVVFAAMRTAIVLVPINWRLKAREVAFILSDSGVRMILSDDAFMATVAEANHADAQVIRVDGNADDDLSARLAAMADMPGAIGGDWEAASLLLYTSGTTGNPKGVQVSEKAMTIARRVEAAHEGFSDWGGDEVLLSPLPLFHVGGISWALCGLYWGGTVVFTNEMVAAAMLDRALAEAVTRTFLVPQLVRGLVEEMVARDVRVPSLKGIHYGAAPMDPPLLHRGLDKIGCRFLQYFGMTEMTGTITILPPEDHDLARPRLLSSVGRVLPGCAIEVRDADSWVVDHDVAGEIWVRGPTMMLGYANRDDLTADAVVDGWYRTGDGGRMDAEGFLFLTDRIKDMIVTGGENVYPNEVETVLREHPAVADCAVFGLPDPQWGERVCAAIELRAGAITTTDEIVAFVKGQIAGFKTPRQLLIVDALPRTASGKVQRGKVREEHLNATR